MITLVCLLIIVSGYVWLELRKHRPAFPNTGEATAATRRKRHHHNRTPDLQLPKVDSNTEILIEVFLKPNTLYHFDHLL